jgi:hypothetical protein
LSAAGQVHAGIQFPQDFDGPTRARGVLAAIETPGL